MKLIKSMLVGVFVLSMVFAQQNPPTGGPPQGGPEGDMNKSAADHFMMAVQEGLDRGVLDANDQEYLMEMVPKMKEAVDSEYNDGADGAAGDVVSEFEEWLQGLYDEGGESAEVAQRLAMELCMVESEAHRMNDPDGDHNDNECHMGSGPGDHDGGDHMGGDDHDGQDHGDDHMGGDDHDGQDHGDDHMGGDDHDGQYHGDDHGDQPPFSPSIMNSVHKYKKNNWAVDDSKMDNQEWMDAYNSYDDWKPEDHGDDHDGGDYQDGPQGGPDGPSEAVVQAWMSGMQPDGFFDFGAAFDAAESTAKAEAQEAGEYDEATWDECADAGRDAMESARDDNKGPQEVFQAVSQAVNACGQAQQEANQD